MPANILIIDDEEQLRSLLKRIITLEGFNVTEAANLSAGRRMLENDHADVVLCDVKLPDGSGVDFVKDIKPKFPFIEIILLTAYANVQDGVQAMKNGAFDYILKGDDNMCTSRRHSQLLKCRAPQCATLESCPLECFWAYSPQP